MNVTCNEFLRATKPWVANMKELAWSIAAFPVIVAWLPDHDQVKVARGPISHT